VGELMKHTGATWKDFKKKGRRRKTTCVKTTCVKDDMCEDDMCMPVRTLAFNVNPKTMHKETKDYAQRINKNKRDAGLYIMNPGPKKARAHIRKHILSFFLSFFLWV